MNIQLITLATLGLVTLTMAMPTQPREARLMTTSTVLDKKIQVDTIEVNAWTDLKNLVTVLETDPALVVGEIRLNRDFRDCLVQTEDRETMERWNQEN